MLIVKSGIFSGGRRLSLSVSGPLSCFTPYNDNKNVLSESLNKTFPSLNRYKKNTKHVGRPIVRLS